MGYMRSHDTLGKGPTKKGMIPEKGNRQSKNYTSVTSRVVLLARASALMMRRGMPLTSNVASVTSSVSWYGPYGVGS